MKMRGKNTSAKNGLTKGVSNMVAVFTIVVFIGIVAGMFAK